MPCSFAFSIWALYSGRFSRTWKVSSAFFTSGFFTGRRRPHSLCQSNGPVCGGALFHITEHGKADIQEAAALSYPKLHHRRVANDHSLNGPATAHFSTIRSTDSQCQADCKRLTRLPVDWRSACYNPLHWAALKVRRYSRPSHGLFGARHLPESSNQGRCAYRQADSP